VIVIRATQYFRCPSVYPHFAMHFCVFRLIPSINSFILKDGTPDASLQFQCLIYVIVEHLIDQQFQIPCSWRKHLSILSSKIFGRFSPGEGPTSFRAVPAIDVGPLHHCFISTEDQLGEEGPDQVFESLEKLLDLEFCPCGQAIFRDAPSQK
jgi:hypothetical protein